MTFVELEILANEMEEWRQAVELDRKAEELELAETIAQVEEDWTERDFNRNGHFFWSKKFQMGIYAPHSRNDR